MMKFPRCKFYKKRLKTSYVLIPGYPKVKKNAVKTKFNNKLNVLHRYMQSN